NTIQLAASVFDLTVGTFRPLTAPAANPVVNYSLTPIDARAVSTFTEAAVNNGTHTIALPHHGFVTGQAVIYHTVPPAGALATLNPNQTYYVIADDPDTIALAASADLAAARTRLNIARNGTGTYTLTARDSLVTETFTGAAVTNP